jgi:hydroxymethylpyrimidine/phosphomethylpyrimidine kinase
MLASAETIKVVSDALRRHNVTISVVDPVHTLHLFNITCLDIYR